MRPDLPELVNQLYALYLQEPLARGEPLPALDSQRRTFLRTLLQDWTLANSTSFNLKEVVTDWLKQ